VLTATTNNPVMIFCQEKKSFNAIFFVMIGGRIKKIRKDKGLTQKVFGEFLGLKQNSIASIESGKNEATESFKTFICIKYYVNREWLETGEGEMYDEPGEIPIDGCVIVEPDTDVHRLLKQAQRVLTSKTHTGAALALAQNIDTFDKAVSDHDALNTDINSSKK
jgi:transcriptional regulator with XRE-family HTH domain